MKKNIQEAMTVIAAVDPSTGKLVSFPFCETSSIVDLHRRVYAKLDAGTRSALTEIGAATASSGDPGITDLTNTKDDAISILSIAAGDATSIIAGRKPSTQVKDTDAKIPQMRASGDQTVVWKEPPRHSVSAMLKRATTHFEDSKNRRRFILLVIAVTILLFVIFSRRKVNGSGFEMMQSAAAEAVPSVGPGAKDANQRALGDSFRTAVSGPVETGVSVQETDDTEQLEPSAASIDARLKDAVDDLVNGRIGDAVEQYSALFEAHPNDPSLALVLQILKSDEERRK